MEEKTPGILTKEDKVAFASFRKSKHWNTFVRLIEYMDMLNDSYLRDRKRTDAENNFLKGCLANGASLMATVENATQTEKSE